MAFCSGFCPESSAAAFASSRECGGSSSEIACLHDLPMARRRYSLRCTEPRGLIAALEEGCFGGEVMRVSVQIIGAADKWLAARSVPADSSSRMRPSFSL